MKKKNADYEALFDKHKGLVYYFANNNRVSFMEFEDYTQSLLMKFWDLVQKFDWGKHKEEDGQRRAFCSYVKTSLTRYKWELSEEANNRVDKLPLDRLFDKEEGLSYLKIFPNDVTPLKEKYYYIKLKELQQEGEVEGYLYDHIMGLNFSQLARKYNCSRGTVRRRIEQELNILRENL